MLAYGRQSIDDDDVAAVATALRSDFLTQGPLVEEFERTFAAAVGARHAVAVCNATAALHLALRVAGVGAGDRVVTSPITFLASANAAAYVGAVPDFADIDPISYTLSPAALEAGWTDATRAVVAVDYAGQAADLPEISRVARERGAVVVADACHAVGGAFGRPAEPGRVWPVGGNPWADITTFSFHPVKTMTTGEGGMLVTDRADWAALARTLRSHGVVRDAARFAAARPGDPTEEKGPWFYEMQELGFNYRMSELQCALGLSQLKRLKAFVERRRRIVSRYNEAFEGHPRLTCPGLRHAADGATTSWHLYTLQVDFASIGKSRTRVMQELRELGVGTQVLYVPVYLQPWYRAAYGYAPGKCPEAERFYARALSLPLYAGLSDTDVDAVIASVKKVIPRS